MVSMIVLVLSQVLVLQQALVGSFECEAGIEAHGASSHETVEAAVAESPPDLIVVDASHPSAKPLVALIRARHTKASVVVLTACERDEEFLAWADLGIAGYLGPDTSGQELVATVRRILAGEVVCPPRLTTLLMKGFANRASGRATRASVHALTTREQEIVALLADGMSNKLIARRLGVALPTVKNHVHSILDKLEVQSRGEAAARYRREEHRAAPNPGAAVEGRVGHIAANDVKALRNGATHVSARNAAF